MPRTYRDLTGERFGRLVVIRQAPRTFPGRRYWLCRCDCGNIKEVLHANLLSETKSCGCFRKEVSSRQEWGGRKIKPDAAQRHLFTQYRSGAKARNLVWELSYEQFMALVSSPCHYTGRLPAKEIVTSLGQRFLYNGIDRIDNNLGYTPENCVPCCFDVNMAKRALSLSDFKQLCQDVLFPKQEFAEEIVEESLCL